MRKIIDSQDKEVINQDAKRQIKFNDLLYSRRRKKSPFRFLIGIILVLLLLYYQEHLTSNVVGFFKLFK
jgi:hypothetical protein